jgi:hypothetical protein
VAEERHEVRLHWMHARNTLLVDINVVRHSIRGAVFVVASVVINRYSASLCLCVLLEFRSLFVLVCSCLSYGYASKSVEGSP